MKKNFWVYLSLMFLMIGCSDEEEVAPGYLPTIEIKGANSVEEGSSITLFLTLDSISQQDISVDYTIESEVATKEDIVGFGEKKTVVFSPGEVIKTINIEVLADEEEENDEAFIVKFSNPQNAKLTKRELTITIKNKAINSGGEAEDFYMEVTIGTKLWQAQIGGFFGAAVLTSTSALAGYGKGADFDSQISFVSEAMFEEGKYTLKKFPGPREVGLSYSPTFFSSGGFGVIYSGFEGELIIESIDLINNIASGAFSGKVKDENDNILELKNGRFKVPIE